MLLAVGRAEKDKPKPRVDCRRRPDVAATAVLYPVNMAVSVNPTIYFEAPDQFPGFCIKGHKLRDMVC